MCPRRQERAHEEQGGGRAHSGILEKLPHSRGLTCCTCSCPASSGSQTSVSSGFLPTFWKWWDRRGRAWGHTHLRLRL